MKQEGLFGNYKYCEICRKPLPSAYEPDLCPSCEEQQLFHKVKEYIRQNDVTEYDVAEHFEISFHRVKQWIKEGRIEYKDKNLNSHVTLYCQKCGAPITFGTLCSKCLKLTNTAGYGMAPTEEPTRMRYLESPEHSPIHPKKK